MGLILNDICGGKNYYYFIHCSAERKKKKEKTYMPKYLPIRLGWLHGLVGREFMMNV